MHLRFNFSLLMEGWCVVIVLMRLNSKKKRKNFIMVQRGNRMRFGSKHSLETRKKISKNTHLAMRRPEVRKKHLVNSYQKGHEPWNKGLKGIHLNPKNEFHEGEFVGEEHPCWKGGVQVMRKDCVYLWDGANKRIRNPRKVWVENFGAIPKGYVVVHRDGNRYNDIPFNLECVSRKELLRRNHLKSLRGVFL